MHLYEKKGECQVKLSDLFGDYTAVPAAGTRIRMASGRVLLVGDINELGGSCDDCRPHEWDEEVAEVVPPADGPATRSTWTRGAE